MPWIESHTVLLRHRKLRDFARALRLKPVYALGHLHALWHAALDQAEDGDLSSWSDEFIAESADYPMDDASRFVSLLRSHGWLDGKLLHDWLDYAGRYLQRKYGTSHPEKLEAMRNKHAEGKKGRPPDTPNGLECRSSVTEEPLHRVPTAPVPTNPHTVAHARGAGAPKRLNGIPATVDEVIAAGKILIRPKSEAACRSFWNHYESQKKTNENGAEFWVTGGENPTIVTHWRNKLENWKEDRSKEPGFWEKSKSLELFEKEIKAIEARASHTAMGVEIEPKDKERYAELKAKRKAIKKELGL